MPEKGLFVTILNEAGDVSFSFQASQVKCHDCARRGLAENDALRP